MPHRPARQALPRLLPLLLAALFAVSACSTGSTSTTPTAETHRGSDGGASAGQGKGSGAASGPSALDFTGTTLAGKAFDAASETGPVVMWFWAPWCTICRAEAPDVATVAAEYEGRVTFLGVPGRGDVGAMKEFVSQTGTSGFDHVADLDGSLWQRFGVVAQPSFVFVDSAGKASFFGGSLDADSLRQMIQPLVAG